MDEFIANVMTLYTAILSLYELLETQLNLLVEEQRMGGRQDLFSPRMRELHRRWLEVQIRMDEVEKMRERIEARSAEVTSEEEEEPVSEQVVVQIEEHVEEEHVEEEHVKELDKLAIILLVCLLFVGLLVIGRLLMVSL